MENYFSEDYELAKNKRYSVGLPNGCIWYYKTEKKAKNAALIARALAAMPIKKKGVGGTIAMYGQQSALAQTLGYHSWRGKADHMDIYCLLRGGYLPRSPERQAKLRELAATMPDNWFEIVQREIKCNEQ